MFTAYIENLRSALLLLPLAGTALNDESVFQVLQIEGLDPPKANLNFTKIANLDGALFNSANLDTRNIVITLKINSNGEYVRNLINSVVVLKENVRFHFSDSDKNVYIDGVVESVTYNLFEQTEIVQISIICPNPNFLDNTENTVLLNKPADSSTEYVNTVIDNDSSFSIGFTLEFSFNSLINTLILTNSTTNQRLAIINHSMAKNSKLTLNTHKGYKSLIYQITSNNVTTYTNFIPNLSSDSEFFMFVSGNNTLNYKASLTFGGITESRTQDVEAKLKYKNEYRGI